MEPIIKVQLVELPVQASGTLNRYYFPTQNFLRAKMINYIETYSANDLTTTPLGNGLPTEANLKQCYLTLYGDNPELVDSEGIKSTGAGEWMQQIPLWALHRTNNLTDPYVRDLFRMIPRNIVWEKSFVISMAALGNGSAISFCFSVGYQGNRGDN